MQYKDFWGKFRQHVEKEQCPLKFKYDNEKQRWTKLELGKSGTILELRPVNTKRIILAQIRFMTPEMQKMFNNIFRNSKADIESEIGSPLKWEENEPGKVTCKINLEEPFDLNDYNRWQWAFNWIIEKANLFMSVFIPRLGGSDVFSSPRKATTNILSSGTFSGETPSKEEIEKILRSVGGETDENTFKEAIKDFFEKEKRTLRPDWWEITKKNLLEWSKKR